MIRTPCPYCQHPQMPVPPKTARPFAACPACGKKSRAVIYYIQGGGRQVKYVATGKGRVPDKERKRVRSIRLSDNDMRAVENGSKTLTISRGRITLAAKQ